EMGGRQRGCACRDGRADEPLDPVAPFAAALCLLAAKVVAAGAGMGVDDAKGRGLLAQMHEDAHQYCVLDHIGEIAGVKGMAVIHGRKVMRANSRLSKS